MLVADPGWWRVCLPIGDKIRHLLYDLGLFARQVNLARAEQLYDLPAEFGKPEVPLSREALFARRYGEQPGPQLLWPASTATGRLLDQVRLAG